ncbi:MULTISPECIES: hypothetical protein [unclassified Bradyrhizobium]|nr:MULTISPECIES: hypothetical protein [unclassified Bradyrhizobium]
MRFATGFALLVGLLAGVFGERWIDEPGKLSGMITAMQVQQCTKAARP